MDFEIEFNSEDTAKHFLSVNNKYDGEVIENIVVFRDCDSEDRLLLEERAWWFIQGQNWADRVIPNFPEPACRYM